MKVYQKLRVIAMDHFNDKGWCQIRDCIDCNDLVLKVCSECSSIKSGIIYKEQLCFTHYVEYYKQEGLLTDRK